ncbi:MAG: hypothetical protein U9P38_04990 [Campylobacterota bacterium]|nr:hypothetical protein [Campylobacterota bacterium]
MRVLFSSIIVIGLFFSGCINNKPRPAVNTKPSWIYNNEGGAVGMCGPHMNGIAAQEESAQNRARTQLALDKLAEVDATVTDKQQENGAFSNSSSKVDSKIVSKTTVSSHVKDSWRDPQTGIYYVWMVTD